MNKVSFLKILVNLLLIPFFSCTIEDSTFIPHPHCQPENEAPICFDCVIENECKNLSASNNKNASDFVYNFSEHYTNIIKATGDVSYYHNQETGKINSLCIGADNTGALILNPWCDLNITLYVSAVNADSTVSDIKLIFQDGSIYTEQNSISSISGSEIQKLQYSVKEGITKVSVAGNSSLLVYRILAN